MIDLIISISLKRSSLKNHLKNNYPQCPKIKHVSLRLIFNCLWGHIFPCPHESLTLVSYKYCLAEIDQSNKALRVKHDIWRFQISENNILGMQILQSLDYLVRDTLCSIISKAYLKFTLFLSRAPALLNSRGRLQDKTLIR